MPLDLKGANGLIEIDYLAEPDEYVEEAEASNRAFEVSARHYSTERMPLKFFDQPDKQEIF